MNDINEKIDLIKGVLKTNLETYGDLLVTLYHKVKKGGALTTTPSERGALYKLANKYQSKLKNNNKNNNKNNKNPLSEIDFSNLVKGIGDNIVVKQMVQWGGSEKNLNKYHKYHQKSKRLKVLYLDYINTYKY